MNLEELVQLFQLVALRELDVLKASEKGGERVSVVVGRGERERERKDENLTRHGLK